MISGWRFALVAAILPLIWGCGQGPKLVPATGTVTHRGKPLTAGSIIFHPDPSNEYQKDRPSSLLQVDGSFTMKTYPFGEGVPLGKYRVTLAPELAARIKAPSYADPEKTPWKVEVLESGLAYQRFDVN